MFEELSWVVLAIILVAIIINHFTQSKHLPPGPFRLPIIGNSHKLAADSRHVDLMAMEKQYGHVFRLYLGSQLVVVVSGANAVDEVLITKSAEFAGPPNFYNGEPLYYQGEAIGLADYSAHWRLHRKISVSALRMYIHEVLRQGTVINYKFDFLVKRIQCRNGQPRDIAIEMRLAVMNVVLALVFGSRYELDDPEFSQFIEMTNGATKMLASVSVMDLFP